MALGRDGALAAPSEWWQSWEDRRLPPSLPTLLHLFLPFLLASVTLCCLSKEM